MPDAAALGAKPDLRWVPLALIDFDHTYQRELRPALVDKIATGFQWRKFGAVVLAAKDDGRFNGIEGQHRVEAARLVPQIIEVPAIVVEHADTQGEADSFIAINRDRVSVTSIERYWAGLAAQHPYALAIAEVLQAAGCDVVPAPSHYRPNLTNSVTAIDRCLQRYGREPTLRAIRAIRAAWPEEAKALRGTLITALARVVKANPAGLEDDELARTIAGRSMAQMTAEAEGFRKLSGGTAETALSRTIADLYNAGKTTGTIFFGAQQ